MALIFSLFVWEGCLSQSTNVFYKDTVVYDSVRHVNFYTTDSVLFKISVFKLKAGTQKYEFIQAINFSKDGLVSSFSSTYNLDIEDGSIMTDELIVTLNNDGKPLKLWWVDNFKLFKCFIFDERKKKYRKVKKVR